MNKNRKTSRKKLTKEEKSELMKKRPLACRIKMPPGTTCTYRAFTDKELEKHEIKHAKAIADNKKATSRNYEICLETSMEQIIKNDATNYAGDMIEDGLVEYLEYDGEYVGLEIEPLVEPHIAGVIFQNHF